MPCPTFFLLSPLSTWNLYSLYIQGRAKAVKNYSLHFQFSEFVKAFYFPVCWALFSKQACCEASLCRPCHLKIWGLLLHAEYLLYTWHSSPTLVDLGLLIRGPPCPPLLMLLRITREKADFEMWVYYAEQGLSLLNYYRHQHGKLQTHKSPLPPCGGSGYCNYWGCCEDLGRRMCAERSQDQEAGEYYLEESIKKWKTLLNNHLSTRTKKTSQMCLPSKVIYNNSRWEMEEQQSTEK